MRVIVAAAILLGTLSSGCVGWETDEPPIVGIRNMYNQPRYDTQEKKPFFEDQRSMRPEIEGTVSQEMMSALTWSTGRTADDEYILEVPPALVAMNGGPQAMVERGRGRYNIFCATCHGYNGSGKGMISRRADQLGYLGLVAKSFHEDRLRHAPDGQIYATIANGIRNMPGYAHNIPESDRWAIVMYIRALQLTQAPQATATQLDTEPSQ